MCNMIRKLKELALEFRAWMDSILIRVRLWAEPKQGGGDEDA